MFQGSLLLLTIVTSAQVGVGSWPPGEGGLGGSNLMGQDHLVPKTNNNIGKDVILRTLRSSAYLKNKKMAKRNSHMRWSSGTGEEETLIWIFEALQDALVQNQSLTVLDTEFR